jgi:xylulose-5-phosphate/fructose-6-phosphate phosphoketolase
MMLCNHVSRYHVAEAALRGAAKHNPRVAVDAHELISHVLHLAQKDHDYIYAHGKGARPVCKRGLLIFGDC